LKLIVSENEDLLSDVNSAKSTMVGNTILRELKKEGKIRVEGYTSAARWYPGPASNCGRNHPEKQ
jgi:hypothetical protein